MNKLKILILDDSERIVFELKIFLEECDYIVYKSLAPSHAFEILDKNEIDIMILDIKLPEMDGLEVLKKVKSDFPDIEVIMITGHGDIEKVIQAMRLGAFDFFNKPFRLMDIQNAIERTKKYVFLSNKLKTVEYNYALVSKELRDKTGYHIAGNSQAIKTVLELMCKVAESDTTSVLITGESGTGKELVARGIHYLSKRKDNYFYAANCSAIPADLFESELFGHVKGAFTGASENKTGWFEMAHKGTLFLDEIGDMPIPFQTKLLRVLEDKKIRKVGSNKEIVTDVRILSATNKDIKKMIEKSSFRSDLYHRFNTFQIHIPPLRERTEDIPLLLEYYTESYSRALNRKIEGIEPRLIEKLKQYTFPGNVRELKNLIERAIILHDNGMLQEEDFPVLKNGGHTSQCEDTECTYRNIPSEDKFNLSLIEKTMICEALKRTDNNKTKASELLKISWYSLDRKMKKYGIAKSQ